MITTSTALTTEIRNKFAHVDACPFSGPRVFFENAGGALTLKSADRKLELSDYELAFVVPLRTMEPHSHILESGWTLSTYRTR